MEFLNPIPPGPGKDGFMAILQERIETRLTQLLGHEEPDKDSGAFNPDGIGPDGIGIEPLNAVAQARADRQKTSP